MDIVENGIGAPSGEIELNGRVCVILSWQANAQGNTAMLKLINPDTGEFHNISQAVEQDATSVCFNALEDPVYISVWLRSNNNGQVDLYCAYPVDFDTEFRGAVAHWPLYQPEPAPLPRGQCPGSTKFNQISIPQWQALFPFLCLQSLNCAETSVNSDDYIVLEKPALVSLYKSLTKDPESLSNLTAFEKIITQFMGGSKWIQSFESVAKPFCYFSSIYDWLLKQEGVDDYSDLLERLECQLGVSSPLSKIFEGEGGDQFYDELWSSTIALMLTNQQVQKNQCLLGQYLRALRSFTFIKKLSLLGNEVKNDESQEENSNEILEEVPCRIAPLFAFLNAVVVLPDAIIPDLLTNEAGIASDSGWLSLVGVGEVYTVYQRADGYILGDIAEITNIMPRELTEKKHLEYQQLQEGLEQLKHNDGDNQLIKKHQSTNDISNEVKQVIANDDRKLDASNLKPSYDNLGLVINGKADLTQTKNDKIDRHIEQCARDISDQAIERVRQRVVNQRSDSVLKETTLLQRREINNTDSDRSIRAVYRWVDQCLSFETRSQGKSLIVEFLINNPAGVFKEKILNDKQLPITPVPVDTFFTEENNYKKITADNYLQYAAQYNVNGIPSPPPEKYNVLIERANEQNQLIEGEITIAEGYVVPATGLIKILTSDGGQKVVGYAGSTDDLEFSSSSGSVSNKSSEPAVYSKSFTIKAGSHSVSYGVITHAPQFSINISIECLVDKKVQATRLEVWQREVFRQLQAGYCEQRLDFNREYNQRIAAASKGKQGCIEREQLKNSAIQLLAQRFKTTESGMLRLIEQWFCWDEMAYRFYEYPAGKPPVVNSARGQATEIDTQDLFSAFLNAGSARVLIPIQKSYLTKALLSLIFNQVWQGAFGNAITIPKVVQVLQEFQLDSHQQEQISVKQWRRTVPTPHCFLQDEPSLPLTEAIFEGRQDAI